MEDSTSMVLAMTPSDVLRLGKKADTEHVKLLHTPAGDTFARSTRSTDVIYHTTPEACDCLGFQYHGRCKHIAKLVRS